MKILSNLISEEMIEGAKMKLFSKLDSVIKPEDKGTADFYFGLTDKYFENYRLNCLKVNKNDIIRVAEEYLLKPLSENKTSKVIFGSNDNDLDDLKEKNWNIINFTK